MSKLLGGLLIAGVGWLVSVLASWRIMGSPLEHPMLLTIFSALFIVGMTASLMLRPYECDSSSLPQQYEAGYCAFAFLFFPFLPFFMLHGGLPSKEVARPTVTVGVKFRKAFGSAAVVSVGAWFIVSLGSIDLIEKVFSKYEEALVYYAVGSAVFYVLSLGFFTFIFWPMKEEEVKAQLPG